MPLHGRIKTAPGIPVSPIPGRDTRGREGGPNLGKMMKGRELGGFLRSRREQLRPADVGLVDRGRRRVPGLRREELASLAGVSVAYYTRLEQGHDKSPSASVIDALADALHLNTGAREHLHLLARPADGRAGSRVAEPEHVRVELAELLEHHVGTPAMVLGRALDVLAANPVAGILHPSYQPGRNLALDVFLDEGAQALYADPEQVRRNRARSLRVAAGALPGDPRLVEVVGELSIRSPAFRTLWARHEIHVRSLSTKRFLHPDVGALELRCSFFAVVGGAHQQLIVYHPEPGTRDAQSIALLGTLAAASQPPTRSADAALDVLHDHDR